MTHIVQIAPAIAPGSGVAGVAYALEREFVAAGATVERFTAADAGRPPGRPRVRTPVATHLTRARNVIWFSTVGTRRARQFLAARPDAVSITHNDVMAGDVYVNHGLLQAAMRARGEYIWRMVRNPVHLFTALRDRIRYRGRTHRAVVALTTTEAELLRSTYGRVHAPIHVIPNGVDIERFRPPDAAERVQARSKLGIDDERTIALFIGHEFERKGLPIAIESLRTAPDVLLLVVGGSPDMIRRARAQARQAGVGERVHFAGSQRDPIPFIWASDVLVLPSAYEANALVVLEALACGLPVVSTRVGFAPDILVDGDNGFIVERNAASVGTRLAELASQPLDEWRHRTRRTAEQYAWPQIARRYLALIESLRRDSAEGEDSDVSLGDGNKMTRPLRILHAIRSDGFSGVEQFVLRLALAQAADGHRVTVIGGATDRMRPPLAEAGIEHVPAARTIEVTRAVRELRGGFDVVNTHMTAAEVGMAVALWFTRRSRRPAVVATRHFAKARGRVGPVPIGPFVRRRIDGQISISRAVADSADGPSIVVHSGIESRPLRDVTLRERVVLMAQRLQPEKRTDVGIRAFAASGLADDGWTLEIAGIGPGREALESLAEELGISSAVEFLGYRGDLPQVMDRAGILIAPCPVEGLGLTLLEAMAGGLPVVAASAAGHLDVLAGLDPRAMFPPGDADAAARNLRSLAEDDTGRNALSLAVRKRQQGEFSLRAQAAATEAVYLSAR
ncbi:glycosyltransferase family 4 protein [Agromyces albus]|uniref:glycosyltransferase family 4 protein n=1 Tax=Agromyces albus TaxID=205332 RepID=UPI002782894F|nr:glycosyltransferase family 4 protein [Agromyces albus]MDQ0577123.1 glycosyltransferase involved in cell wall biosynthesis [Agromyces albus]